MNHARIPSIHDRRTSRQLCHWIFLGLILFGPARAEAQSSTLVYEDANGDLIYGNYPNQGQANSVNTVPDFSSAGYKGGGIPIPFVPAVVTINAPTGGDDTTLIQNAINQVAALPIDGNGFRGAVLIKAGNYKVASTLIINASGIVIRGEGSQSSGGTKVTMTATVQDNLFEVLGSGYYPASGNTVSVTDAFVPSGAKSFNVNNASAYSVGNEIRIVYKMNQKWIDDIRMNNIIDPIDGNESWTPSEFQLTYERKVTAVTGNTIQINIPLVQSIETQYGGAEVSKLGNHSGRIANIGFEALRLESTYLSDNDEAHGWTAIHMQDTENAWVRQVTAKYFGMSCVKVSARCRNVTIEDSAMVDPKSITDGGRKYSFSIDDCTSVLVQRCYTWGGRHDFVSGSLTPGPNVFVDSLSENAKDDVGPHFRYATGELYDNIKTTEMRVHNRGDWGTGHGWAGAQVMFWNSVATMLACDAPPAGMNWAIGCVGSKVEGRITTEAYGTWQSHYTHVTPRSLYYRQLQARLGETSLRNILLPQQADGTIWNALASWAGDGLFSEPLVVWNDTLVRPLSNTASLKGVVRNLKLLDANATSTWSKVSGPGTVTFGNASALETSASFSAQGEYVLRLLVTAGVTSISKDITITALTAANQPPVANTQAVTLDANTSRGITLTGFDWDNSPLTFTAQTNPSNGSLTGILPNVIYTPNNGYTGPDSFTFTVSDGTYTSAPASINVTVAGIDPNLLAHWKFDEASGLVADDASAADGSPSEHDGTLTNMTGTAWDGIGALAFDGVNDRVVATGFSGVTGSSPRTVMAWIKTTANGCIVGWGPNTSGNKYYWLIENGALKVEVNGGFLTGTTLVNDGQWRHVALVFPTGGVSSSDHLFYINGVLDSPLAVVAAKNVNTASGVNVTIGSNPAASGYLAGSLDDVRIYNRALTPTEIAQYAAARPMLQGSPGLIELVSSVYSQSEAHTGASTVTIAVERKGGLTGAAAVNYATSNGTATLANGDYAAASGTLNWADGELGYKTFTITINGDTAVEPNETFNLALSNVVGAITGPQSTATITILDDDLPAVSVVANDYAASETGPDPGSWTISRIGHTTATLAVSFSHGGTAVKGSDYTTSSNSPVTIPAGQSSVNVTLTPVDDNVFGERNETAILTLTPSANYSFGVASALVNIADNDNHVPEVDAGNDRAVVLSAPPWTPAQTNASLWLDAQATNTITQSAGKVSQWADRSGNGNHAAQPTAANRPTTGIATINGYNAIEFTAANAHKLDVAHHASLLTDSTGGSNIFSVFNHGAYLNQTSTFNSLISKGSLLSTSLGYGIHMSSSSAISFKAAASSFSTAFNRTNQNILFGGLRNDAAQQLKLYLNGTVQSTVTGTPPYASDSTSILRIGGDAASESRCANAKFGEIIFLPGVVSDDTRLRLEGYLAHQWGLATSLPAGHPYKTSAPLGVASASVTLDGTISDLDSDPLTSTWSQVSGPAAVTFGNVNAVDTTAHFTATGTYMLRLTANDADGSAFSEITISVVESTTYNVWATGNFTNSLIDIAVASNPDNDVLNNLQEFAFGTDPTSSSLSPLAYVPGGNLTQAGIPVLENTGSTEAPIYQAVFTRRKDYQATGLTYTVQFSADLSAWTPSAAGLQVETDAGSVGNLEAVSVPFPDSVPLQTTGNGYPKFFRVGVSNN